MKRHACLSLSTLVALSATLAQADAAAEEPMRTVTATIRDFSRGDLGGHPDFNTSDPAEWGLRSGIVANQLGPDRRPVFSVLLPEEESLFSSAANFNQWYRDVAGVNQTFSVEIGLGPRADDPSILTTEGYNTDHFIGTNFFPINGLGFGNQGHPSNYGFTTHFTLPFSYIAGSALNFSGDDDVWAFINGNLAIDLGGVHTRLDAAVLLLDGRMFVELSGIPVGGGVNALDAADVSRLQTDWERLGLPGNVPVAAETHGWVDLGLDIEHDSRCLFDPSGLSVQAYTAGPPPKEVRLSLVNGRAETRPWAGNGATYTVTGQPIVGLDIISADGSSVFFTPAGRGQAECQLDFFHAERQFELSEFRIDTTMLGQNEADVVFTGYD